MRAAICPEHGPPEIVRIDALAAPDPGAGQVRVAVRAASAREVFASDGDTPEAHRRYREEHGLAEVPYVVSTALGLTYQVSRLPHAYLVDEAGVLRARGLVNSREHLESLFEAHRLGVASLQEYFARAGSH